MTSILHLDFETASEIDLRKVGAFTYAMHPSTRVLCMAWRFDDGPVFVWSPHLQSLGIPAKNGIVEGVPAKVFDHIDAELPVAGWNVGFEFLIWNHVLPRTLNGLPRMEWSQLRDVMAQAAYHGLPLSLDQAAAALPLGVQKDKTGHLLMLRMARPRVKGSRAVPAVWWHDSDAGKLSALMEYCRQDVHAESAIERYLPELPARERDIWEMDFRANARGIKLDTELCRQMLRVAFVEASRLNASIMQATSCMVSTTTKAVELADWLNNRWNPVVPIVSVAKEHLPKLIEEACSRKDHMALAALQAREEAAKSSVAKVHAMTHWAGADGRMHGLTAYYGAFRTGRWAGRGPQVQNFPRPMLGKDEVASVIRYFLNLRKSPPDADATPFMQGFDMFWGLKPLDAIKTSLRGCLIPTPGKLFASVDFSQIEARVLAWLAQERWVLQAYEDGEDLYARQAGAIFGVPERHVTPFQRQAGKVGVLACGYGGGVAAYEKMAANYDLDLSKLDLPQVVAAYRDSVPSIKEYWGSVERAAKLALTAKKPVVAQVVTQHSNQYPGSIPEVQFARWRGHLICRLPSGRNLYYREAKIVPGKFGNGAVSYMGVNQFTKQWTRIETWGGMLVENITQAVARDLLADAMLAADKLPGVDLLGSVHDEILAEVTGHAAYARLLATMKTGPYWAGGLPIDAAGYCGERFGK